MFSNFEDRSSIFKDNWVLAKPTGNKRLRREMPKSRRVKKLLTKQIKETKKAQQRSDEVKNRLLKGVKRGQQGK